MRFSLLFIAIILLISEITLAQPGGTVIAKGFIGDGSQLSNLKPIIKFSEPIDLAIADNNSEITIASVTIEIPEKGIVLVNASGNVIFNNGVNSINEVFRVSLNDSPSLDFSCMHLIADNQSLRAGGLKESWSIDRGYTFESGGIYTFHCIGNAPISGSIIRVENASISAVYYPTGGEGENEYPPEVTQSGTIAAAQGFIGDGSQLSNVKSLVAYEQGEMQEILPNDGSDVVIKSVSLNVPKGDGYYIAKASGNAHFTGPGEDVFRVSLASGNGFSELNFDNLVVISDNGSSGSNQGASWTVSKTVGIFINTVNGPLTINCICDSFQPFPSSVEVRDVFISLVWVPLRPNLE